METVAKSKHELDLLKSEEERSGDNLMLVEHLKREMRNLEQEQRELQMEQISVQVISLCCARCNCVLLETA